MISSKYKGKKIEDFKQGGWHDFFLWSLEFRRLSELRDIKEENVFSCFCFSVITHLRNNSGITKETYLYYFLYPYNSYKCIWIDRYREKERSNTQSRIGVGKLFL